MYFSEKESLCLREVTENLTVWFLLANRDVDPA
jgi:hypothetical protein